MKTLLLPFLVGLAAFSLLACGGKKEAQASRENISQFYGAIRDFQEENGGMWPETFEDLKPYIDNWDEVIVNPITGDNPGYQYTPPPPATSSDPDEDESTDAVVLTQLRDGKPDLSLKKLHKGGHLTTAE